MVTRVAGLLSFLLAAYGLENTPPPKNAFNTTSVAVCISGERGAFLPQGGVCQTPNGYACYAGSTAATCYQYSDGCNTGNIAVANGYVIQSASSSCAGDYVGGDYWPYGTESVGPIRGHVYLEGPYGFGHGYQAGGGDADADYLTYMTQTTANACGV